MRRVVGGVDECHFRQVWRQVGPEAGHTAAAGGKLTRVGRTATCSTWTLIRLFTNGCCVLISTYGGRGITTTTTFAVSARARQSQTRQWHSPPPCLAPYRPARCAHSPAHLSLSLQSTRPRRRRSTRSVRWRRLSQARAAIGLHLHSLHLRRRPTPRLHHRLMTTLRRPKPHNNLHHDNPPRRLRRRSSNTTTSPRPLHPI